MNETLQSDLKIDYYSNFSWELKKYKPNQKYYTNTKCFPFLGKNCLLVPNPSGQRYEKWKGESEKTCRIR